MYICGLHNEHKFERLQQSSGFKSGLSICMDNSKPNQELAAGVQFASSASRWKVEQSLTQEM